MSKGFLLAFFCLAIGYGARSQENWGGGVDDERFNFGFQFNYVSSGFEVLKIKNWQGLPSPEGGEANMLRAVGAPSTPGFGVGLVSNMKMTDHTDLRFTPSMIFADKELQFAFANEGVYNKVVHSTFIDLPLGVKLKSDRKGNFRAYMIAGGKYSRNIVSRKKLDDSELVEAEKFIANRRGFFSYEAGLGLDFYFEYFKMSPEIKFSQSFNSVLDRRKNYFDNSLDKLYHKGIQISLFFE
ncbi:outer membrane beta-barrel protein [Arcticibacter sp.]|uniref:type IX secretion/gliding motility protein PorT/SprT n=1 Tax=Arcticibacter sp. TaxID=1872630 RepID=UPI00388E5895